MANAKEIEIEVAYAEPDDQRIVELVVVNGTSAREALRLSGLAQEFPTLDVDRAPLGIFGRSVADDYVVKAGDRVEAYRPLVLDPGEARRARAAAGKGPER